MSWAIAGGILGSAALNMIGGDKAAKQQAAATDRATAEQRRQYDLSREDMAPWREAGANALGEYAGYGRSQVDPNQYIPGTNIPQFSYGNQLPQYAGGQGAIPEFNVGGEISRFDPNSIDMYADPSYQFRVAEGENAINRNMAGMGKVMSGNRLGELQKYGQDMASKEYGAMYGRALDDYQMRRAAEEAQYGRDVTAYDAGYRREGDIYNRGLQAYDIARQGEQDQYGRAVDAYKMRALEEDAGYNRGLQRYNIAYGTEADYLNRLSGISGVGQNTAMGGAQIGQGYANNISNLQVQGGQAQAAGTMGRYNALGNMVNQGAMLYGMGAFDSPTYRTDYSIPMTSRSW